MEVRTIFYTFVVLMWYDLALADMSKMIFLPDAGAQPPPVCPPNEMFKNCLNNCSNCEERGFCSYTSCTESGCDCWPRFFRLTPGGPCEPVGKCPKKECPENEVFRGCGPLCERCGLFGCRLIQCNHQCYCKEGYKRDFFGDCIPEEECPQRMRCSKGEQMADSGPVDEFCLGDPLHPRSTEIQNIRKCYCQPGYKRNALGHCIEERLCPYVSCIGYEVYMNCVPACNTTCRNYGDPDCKEDGQCFPGCFCPPGYVMNDYQVCVLIENCETENERILFFGTHEEEKSQPHNQTTVVTEAQTTIPPEEKTEINSQTQTEAYSEVQSETQTGIQSETQSETHVETQAGVQSETHVETQAGVQSETHVESQTEQQDAGQSESQTQDQSSSQGELETQAEKPLETQDAGESAGESSSQAEGQSQEDVQSDSETSDQSQSEAASEQAEESDDSQAETYAESKTASETEGDAEFVKEEIVEEAPMEEGIEIPAAVDDEPTVDEVDETETTTTTKAPKQSRRRSSSGNSRGQETSYKIPKRRKQFREDANEK